MRPRISSRGTLGRQVPRPWRTHGCKHDQPRRTAVVDTRPEEMPCEGSATGTLEVDSAGGSVRTETIFTRDHQPGRKPAGRRHFHLLADPLPGVRRLGPYRMSTMSSATQHRSTTQSAVNATGSFRETPPQWRPRLICDCTEQFRMLTVRELRSLDTSPEFDHMRKSEALLRGFLLADAGLSQFAGANRTFPINGRNEPDQPRSSRPGGSAGVRRGGTVGSRSLAVMNGRPPHGYLFIAAAAGCPRGLARS